jgi:hypothetical protein
MSSTEPTHDDILKNIERHDAAAGHPGVMRSGSLIIKPCTQAEIDFYALATQTQPLFAAWMPTYMGQLALNKPGQGTTTGAVALESERFERAIVLENLEWGFKRPSVLDIKLGKILTDEHVTEEKRIRLEKTSMSTTSWEHHLRLTGMKVCAFLLLSDIGLGSCSRRTGCLSEVVRTRIDYRDSPRGVCEFLWLTNQSHS